MMPDRNRLSLWIMACVLLAAALLAIGLSVTIGPAISDTRHPRLGLMGTVPIYWGETGGMDETLSGTARPHWARAVLERDYELVPLDSLAGESGPSTELAQLDQLLLVQPRALSPAENVALDNWVRAGGKLLLFADPMLTGASRFAIGDRRRPQDVVMLSPILGRWGLELQFDPAQPDGERIMTIGKLQLPVALAGTFRKMATAANAPARCALTGQGLVAQCAIGKGSVVVVADAALLDFDAPETLREAALQGLADQAFSPK